MTGGARRAQNEKAAEGDRYVAPIRAYKGARKVRCTTAFAWQLSQFRQNSQLGGHDVGTIMSILQTVILSLILLWMPGMLLGAYLVMARPSHLENPVSHEPDQ
jgi:hypothetical protein